MWAKVLVWAPLGSMVRDLRAAEVVKAWLGSTGLKTFASGKSVPWSQWRVSRASEGEKLRTRLYVHLHVLAQQTGHIAEQRTGRQRGGRALQPQEREDPGQSEVSDCLPGQLLREAVSVYINGTNTAMKVQLPWVGLSLHTPNRCDQLCS